MGITGPAVGRVRQQDEASLLAMLASELLGADRGFRL